MDTLQTIIRQYWGYDTWYPLQREAMARVMAGKDSLVVLPTGGGKSLCYQAPVLSMPGMAVVVSPLLSLMKDQVDALNTNGVPAARIDSTLTGSERTAIHEAIQERRMKLLYVSPERMAQPSFTAYLQVIGVAYFVVDEAHCISHWGHDFRPEYRALRTLRDNFPDTAIHAYTATATEHVRRDILEQLHLNTPETLIGAFDRPNLFYRSLQRQKGMGQTMAYLEEHLGESGIIYCLRRADVDALCAALTQKGFKALPYHAGMTPLARKRNQDAFSKDEVDIIVATIAFGMGIDKSNVRFVLHTGMPKSIEHYQQETGRAGRDGLPADCCLLYSYQDFRVGENFANKLEDPDARQAALRKLRDMLQYAQQMVCRHKVLSEYFGQPYQKTGCEACDVCCEQFETVEDAAAIAGHVLQAIRALDAIAGPQYTTLVLTGANDMRIQSRGHDTLPVFGKLTEYGVRTVRDWIEQLVQQGYLEKQGKYNILTITRKGWEALNGDATPLLTAPTSIGTTTPQKPIRAARTVANIPVDPALFDRLRQTRLEKARELGVAPFVIFSDATLRDMARRLPDSPDAFLAVDGVGLKKREAFGDAFLEVIRDYLENRPEEAPPPPPPREPEVKLKANAVRQHAAELFRQGIPIEEIAENLNRSPKTVEGYLARHYVENSLTDPAPYATEALLQRIHPIFEAQGDSRLRPIYEALDGEVPWYQIRVCIACLKNRGRDESA